MYPNVSVPRFNTSQITKYLANQYPYTNTPYPIPGYYWVFYTFPYMLLKLRFLSKIETEISIVDFVPLTKFRFLAKIASTCKSLFCVILFCKMKYVCRRFLEGAKLLYKVWPLNDFFLRPVSYHLKHRNVKICEHSILVQLLNKHMFNGTLKIRCFIDITFVVGDV